MYVQSRWPCGLRSQALLPWTQSPWPRSHVTACAKLGKDRRVHPVFFLLARELVPAEREAAVMPYCAPTAFAAETGLWLYSLA